MEADDPEAYRSEVLGEFRSGVATLFDPDAIEACVIPGRRELPPSSELRYSAFVDPSGGRRDNFAVAIGHRSGERLIVDALRAWKPPFNPSGVVEEAAALRKSYSVLEVTGDQYAGDWPRESVRSQGITYKVSKKDKSQLYLELLPVVNAGTVELLDARAAARAARVGATSRAFGT